MINVSRRNEFLFATLLLLLLAYRLVIGLNAESLWGDEGWSVRFTDGTSPRSVGLALVDDRHPPLYFMLLYGWRHVASEDEIPLRLLAVFPTLIAAALIYCLGRRLFGGSAGLAALLILTLLDKQIVFSQEVRHYSWLMLWTIASTYTLLGWIRADRPYRGLAYVLTLTAGLYTHSFMLIVLLVQGVYAMISLRPFKRWWRLVSLWALAFAAFAPWGLVFVHQYQEQGGLKHDFPLTQRILEMLTEQFLGKPVTLFAGLLLLGVISPLISKSKNRPQKNAVLLPFLGLIIPLAIIVGLPLLSDNFKLLTDRNLVIIVPSLALLIGLGVTAFEGFPRAALIAFLLINGVFSRDVILNNPPMRPISRYIAVHQMDDQPVMVEVGGADAALAYHLRQEINPHVRLISALQLREDYKNKGIEPLTTLRFEALEGVEGLWYVYWNNDPEFLNALSAWGYVRTATANDFHLGKPIYMYRYDSEAIADRKAAVFGGQMTLHQVEFDPQVRGGDSLPIALWWSTAQPITTDYTVSAFVLNEVGQLLAQHDGFPQDGQMPSSLWQPAVLLFDLHAIPINLPAGDYQVGVKVYNGMDSSVLATEEGEDFFHAGTVTILEN